MTPIGWPPRVLGARRPPVTSGPAAPRRRCRSTSRPAFVLETPSEEARGCVRRRRTSRVGGWSRRCRAGDGRATDASGNATTLRSWRSPCNHGSMRGPASSLYCTIFSFMRRTQHRSGVIPGVVQRCADVAGAPGCPFTSTTRRRRGDRHGAASNGQTLCGSRAGPLGPNRIGLTRPTIPFRLGQRIQMVMSARWVGAPCAAPATDRADPTAPQRRCSRRAGRDTRSNTGMDESERGAGRAARPGIVQRSARCVREPFHAGEEPVAETVFALVEPLTGLLEVQRREAT